MAVSFLGIVAPMQFGACECTPDCVEGASACIVDDDCCSGTCDDFGLCTSLPDCSEDGSLCSEDGDCCTNVCNTNGSICGCARSDEPCGRDLDCCSGACEGGTCIALPRPG
ncbi:hypothetical protein ACMHYB_38535 [Sorangium sp. So ce1128]